MVYPEKRLIHIHPPKTGGQAIQEVLGVPSAMAYDLYGACRHATLAEIREQYPWASHYRVAISLRDPGERLVSFYYYVVYDRVLQGDETKRYLDTFASVERFLEDADFDYLRSIDEGEAILRPMCWYARRADVQIRWWLEEVGMLIPVVNRYHSHYKFRELGVEPAENDSLMEFLAADYAEWGSPAVL